MKKIALQNDDADWEYKNIFNFALEKRKYSNNHIVQ